MPAMGTGTNLRRFLCPGQDIFVIIIFAFIPMSVSVLVALFSRMISLYFQLSSRQPDEMSRSLLCFQEWSPFISRYRPDNQMKWAGLCFVFKNDLPLFPGIVQTTRWNEQVSALFSRMISLYFQVSSRQPDEMIRSPVVKDSVSINIDSKGIKTVWVSDCSYECVYFLLNYLYDCISYFFVRQGGRWGRGYLFTCLFGPFHESRKLIALLYQRIFLFSIPSKTCNTNFRDSYTVLSC